MCSRQLALSEELAQKRCSFQKLLWVADVAADLSQCIGHATVICSTFHLVKQCNMNRYFMAVVLSVCQSGESGQINA